MTNRNYTSPVRESEKTLSITRTPDARFLLHEGQWVDNAGGGRTFEPGEVVDEDASPKALALRGFLEHGAACVRHDYDLRLVG